MKKKKKKDCWPYYQECQENGIPTGNQELRLPQIFWQRQKSAMGMVSQFYASTFAAECTQTTVKICCESKMFHTWECSQVLQYL
jgi:hypothetical protein